MNRLLFGRFMIFSRRFSSEVVGPPAVEHAPSKVPKKNEIFMAPAYEDSSTAPLVKTKEIVDPSKLEFDEVTHTGQAWDANDYRLVRFTYWPKQVNPNFAIDLIAQVPPKPCEERVTFCDGGDGPMGHPKVYINLDKPGNHGCGYCGLRFYNVHVKNSGEEHIQV